ncbi:MAG: polymorphic toxin type 37 domain-containing protein [Bacillota bacterium]|nr:polymorphic toxin type 37 domain-containing protein [Bacillota bacterium]
MGASKAGNFGNTIGSKLDALSDALSVVSLIPGLDTFTDIASIPVDLARGDFLSAGFDLIGVIPVIGEIGDTAKLAKVVDNAVDAAKAVDKSTDAAKSIKKALKYPGNNPSKSPSKGFEWRGSSTPSKGKGNWFNPKTGEKWNADLKHGDPIGPHWDYTDSNGIKYRVYPDGRKVKK